MQEAAILAHLNQGDSAKKKVALNLLIQRMQVPNHTYVPPKSVLRMLMHCLCDPSDLASQVIKLLTQITADFPAYAHRFLEENMCAVVVHLFASTHTKKETAEMALQLPVDIPCSDLLRKFFSKFATQAGMHWYPNCCLIGQFILEHSKGMDTRTKQFVEHPDHIVPLLVHYIVCFTEGKNPDIYPILVDNGKSFMKNALKSEDPFVKAIVVLGLNYGADSECEAGGTLFVAIFDHITAEYEFLCSQAITYCSNCILAATKSNHKLDALRVDMGVLINLLKKFVSTAALISSLLLYSETYVKKFIQAGGISVLKEQTASSIGLKMKQDHILLIYDCIAATEFGLSELKGASVAVLLPKYMEGKRFNNVALAFKLLVLLGEDVTAYIDGPFIKNSRSLGIDWFEMLGDLRDVAVHCFLPGCNVDVLFAPETRDRGVQFMTRFLMEFVDKPLHRDGMLQLDLIIQHPLIMGYVAYLSGADIYEPGGRTKWLCAGLLSITSDKVRSRLIDDGKIKTLVDLFKMENEHESYESLLQALSLIAFCNPAKFVQQGGRACFMELLRHNDYDVLYGIWALISNAPDALKSLSGIEKVLPHKDYDSFARYIWNTIKNPNFAITLPTKTFGTIRARIEEAYAKLNQELSVSSLAAYTTVFSHFISYVFFIQLYTLERVPETKNVLDSIWLFITWSRTATCIETVEIDRLVAYMTKHWQTSDVNSPRLLTRAILIALKLNLQQQELRIGSEEFSWVLGNDIANDELFIELKRRADEYQNQVVDYNKAVTKETNTLVETIKKFTASNIECKKQAKQLKKDNKRLTRFNENLTATDLENASNKLLQANSRVRNLETQLKLPPTDHLLLDFASKSSIDPIELLNLDNVTSLEQLSALKNKLMGKTKIRKAALMRDLLAQHERVMLCPICMDKLKNTTFVPCGHAMCEVCSTAILSSNTNRCPICRVDVELKNPLYL